MKEDSALRSEVMPPPPTPIQLLLAACIASAVVAVAVIAVAAMLSRTAQVVAPVVVHDVVEEIRVEVCNAPQDDVDLRCVLACGSSVSW